jgi:hypothetical protein
MKEINFIIMEGIICKFSFSRGGGGAPLTNMDYGNSNYSRDSNPFLREEQDASSKKLALQSELKFQIEQKESMSYSVNQNIIQ